MRRNHRRRRRHRLTRQPKSRAPFDFKATWPLCAAARSPRARPGALRARAPASSSRPRNGASARGSPVAALSAFPLLLLRRRGRIFRKECRARPVVVVPSLCCHEAVCRLWDMGAPLALSLCLVALLRSSGGQTRTAIEERKFGRNGSLFLRLSQFSDESIRAKFESFHVSKNYHNL